MKAKINLKNIKGYLQAHFRQALDDMDFLPQHIKEQAEWRIKQVASNSPECLKSDSCVHCGCQVSSKVFEDRKCEGNCYPAMMSEEQWEDYTKPEEPFGEAVMDTPGIGGTKFKVKLNKHYFSGNMIPEQIEDIARDLGFYDSGNIKPLAIVESGKFVILYLSKDETLADIMQSNPHLSKEDILKLVPKCCPICSGNQCTNDGYPCYFCKPEEFKQQTS